MKIRSARLVISLLMLVPLVSVGAQELPAQAKRVGGILVPVPKEIFRTLDEFQNSNWRAVQRPEIAQWKPHGDPVQISLLLGAVIAEGFIATQAQDEKQIKEIGSRVLQLARALGVEHAALRRSRSMIQAAEHNEWKVVRQEWDHILADLEREMIALRSESLAQLVSVGGWLRGTEALSELILQHYSEDAGRLLRQPAMMAFLETRLLATNERIRTHPLVVQTVRALWDFRSLTGDGEETISEAAVGDVRARCQRLLLAIQAGNS